MVNKELQMIAKKALADVRCNAGICWEGQRNSTKHFTAYEPTIRTRSKDFNCSKATFLLPQLIAYTYALRYSEKSATLSYTTQIYSADTIDNLSCNILHVYPTVT
jgi:hypothetical protein